MMSVSEEWNWVKCSENRKTCEDFTSEFIWISKSSVNNFVSFRLELLAEQSLQSLPCAKRGLEKVSKAEGFQGYEGFEGWRRTFRSMSLFRSSVLILFWHSKVHKDAADFPFPLLPHRSAIVVSSDCNINIGLNMLQMQRWNNKRSNTKLETKPTTKGPKQTLNKSRRQHAGG